MSKNDTLEAFAGKTPQLGQNVFVANGARVIGDVTLEDNVNIWHNAVLRGDVHPIFIGANTNIQDNSTVHVMHDYPAIIGRDVTVGHNAIVHGCKVGNNCLIGMGAILLSYCEIGDNCIVAAGSLVPERTDPLSERPGTLPTSTRHSYSGRTLMAKSLSATTRQQ